MVPASFESASNELSIPQGDTVVNSKWSRLTALRRQLCYKELRVLPALAAELDGNVSHVSLLYFTLFFFFSLSAQLFFLSPISRNNFPRGNCINISSSEVAPKI